MSWSITKKPVWAPNAIATKRGWEQNNEVLVAIGNLQNRRRDLLDVQIDNLTLGDGFDLLLGFQGDEPIFLRLE